MIEYFLCRVSHAGVPHTVTHSPNIAQATVCGIEARDMCTLFWLLSSIRLRYSFEINGVSISRDFSVTSTLAPKNRLIIPANFYATAYDSATATSCLCRLPFDTVFFDENLLCGVKFQFSEIDTTGAINFNIAPVSGMQNVNLPVQFFNCETTVYLNYLPSVITSAQINYFEITLGFFE
jgi:hypothetical protein